MEHYFADYDCWSEEDIVAVLPDRIELRNGQRIVFEDCAEMTGRLFQEENPAVIGEKSSAEHSVVFYCPGRPLMIRFFRKNCFREWFSASVDSRFGCFCDEINHYGYQFREEMKY